MFGKLFCRKHTSANPQDALAARHGIDLEMSYCPCCGDEYRAGINQCVHCNVALLSGREKLNGLQQKEQQRAGRSMNISSQDALATIRTGNLKDLKSLQRLLASECIPALLRGDAVSCSKG